MRTDPLDRTPRTTVVIATRNRREELTRTLERVVGLPAAPPVIVVDNASCDGTAEAVRSLPSVRLIALDRNLGAVARNAGVQAATTPYVAFADDDSWWQRGALETAADVFDREPRLGAVVARLIVEPNGEEDPATMRVRERALRLDDEQPGPAVLGFLACAAVVRREAFLAVGGFSDLLFFGGEEQLLALDLTASGWWVCHLPEVVAHHAPSEHREPFGERWGTYRRNDVLTAWLRRRPAVVTRATAGLLRDAAREPQARRAIRELAVRLPAAMRQRRSVPPRVEALAARWD